MLTMSLQELKMIAGNSTDGEILYNALHKKLKLSDEQSNIQQQASKGFRATLGRKRFKYSKSK